MKILYSSTESTYALLEIPYHDWLSIKESPVFDLNADQDDSHWLFLHQSASLSLYSGLVSLMKVGDELYKLDGKTRKELWQSGKLQPPDTLMAQVFAISEIEFSALNAEVQAKRINTLPTNELIQGIYEELGLNFTSERI